MEDLNYLDVMGKEKATQVIIDLQNIYDLFFAASNHVEAIENILMEKYNITDTDLENYSINN